MRCIFFCTQIDATWEKCETIEILVVQLSQCKREVLCWQLISLYLALPHKWNLKLLARSLTGTTKLNLDRKRAIAQHRRKRCIDHYQKDKCYMQWKHTFRATSHIPRRVVMHCFVHNLVNIVSSLLVAVLWNGGSVLPPLKRLSSQHKHQNICPTQLTEIKMCYYDNVRQMYRLWQQESRHKSHLKYWAHHAQRPCPTGNKQLWSDQTSVLRTLRHNGQVNALCTSQYFMSKTGLARQLAECIIGPTWHAVVQHSLR